LPRADRRSLLIAAVLLAPTRVALRLGRVASVKRAVGRAAGMIVRRPSADAVRRIPWAVTTAGRHVPGGRHCLAKAIVAKALLDAEGVPVRLRVGVRRDEDGVLRGHAWLDGEHGLVMDAGEDPVSFVPLPALQEAIDGR
jgi:hypothetical protein